MMASTARRKGIWAAAAAGLLVAACSGGDEIGSAEGELLVLPTSLSFPQGYVGHTVERPVRLQNTGRTELVVTVEIEGPFETEEGPYHLPGGADVQKSVAFAPTRAGEHRGVLRYTQGERVVEIALSGVASIPRTCSSPGPCFRVWFDPATGNCVTEELAEGESCEPENACFTDGICVNKECRGTPRSCDDGNACTEDRCDPAEGCVHNVRSCPTPSNPCQEATCHPASGCGTVDVRDGTACGDTSSCVVRHHCLQGECREFDPEGRPCTAACGPGICRDDVCQRDDPSAVDEPGFATAKVAAGREVVFPGLSAEDGTVVWFEVAADGSAAYLAALAPGDGTFAVRYRDVPLSGIPGPAGAVLSGDRAVIALDRADGGPAIEARWISDGSPAWGPTDLADLLALAAPLPDDLAAVALVDDRGPGNDRAGAVRVVAVAGGRTAVVALDPAGVPGPPAWLDGTPVVAPGGPAAVADSAGRLYLVVESEGAGRRIVSLFGDGTPRWERPADDDEGGPLAVANGALVIAPGRVLDGNDGAVRFDLPLAPAAAGSPGPAPAPILGLLAGFGVDGGDALTPPSLRAFDVANGALRGSRDLVLPGAAGTGFWTAPILTTNENAVVALQLVPGGDNTAAMLVSGFLEVRPDGQTARACLVPDLDRLAGPPVLRSGWFAFAERHGAVKLYQLKRGAEAASWGWSGPSGSPGGGNREGR
jgi:hypothetical protein